jgi:hypothetical protein
MRLSALRSPRSIFVGVDSPARSGARAYGEDGVPRAAKNTGDRARPLFEIQITTAATATATPIENNVPAIAAATAQVICVKRPLK